MLTISNGSGMPPHLPDVHPILDLHAHYAGVEVDGPVHIADPDAGIAETHMATRVALGKGHIENCPVKRGHVQRGPT